MNDNPLVSVIVPIYNTEKYLNKCVDSILSQSYQNMEIWLVDDGSTDKSGNMCDSYRKIDSRVRVIHKNNGGLSDARNSALNQMSGKYVAFIDSDDWISENWVKKLLSAIALHKADIAVGGVCGVSLGRYLFSTLNFENKVFEQPEIMIQYINSLDFKPTVTNKLYSAELFSKIRFPYGRINEDAFLTHEILGNSKRVTIAGGCYYYQRIREGSITQQKISAKSITDRQQASEEMLKYYRDYYLELDKLATMKYINVQMQLIIEINTSKKSNIFEKEEEFIQRRMMKEIERLSKIEGLDYGYHLFDELNMYINDKTKFRYICAKKRRRTKFKKFLKKIILFLYR